MVTSELEEAHAAIQRALQTGSIEELRVAGFGEVTLAVAWPSAAPTRVFKRLPTFPSAARFERYASLLRENLSELHRRGVPHVPTDLESVPGADGAFHGYLVQPLVPSSLLASELVRRGSRSEARRTLRQVVTHVVNAVDSRLGLDAQLPNWALVDGSLATLDVSTPFMRDRDGRERLDLRLFGDAYPALVRTRPLRWLTRNVLDTYYDVRAVLRDVAANMLRQDLHAWLGTWLEEANACLGEPLSEREVGRYFRRDVRRWAFLQRMRRAERWWHRRVRGRPYPFLLPPPYDSRTDYSAGWASERSDGW